MNFDKIMSNYMGNCRLNSTEGESFSSTTLHQMGKKAITEHLRRYSRKFHGKPTCSVDILDSRWQKKHMLSLKSSSEIFNPSFDITSCIQDLFSNGGRYKPRKENLRLLTSLLGVQVDSWNQSSPLDPENGLQNLSQEPRLTIKKKVFNLLGRMKHVKLDDGTGVYQTVSKGRNASAHIGVEVSFDCDRYWRKWRTIFRSDEVAKFEDDKRDVVYNTLDLTPYDDIPVTIGSWGGLLFLCTMTFRPICVLGAVDTVSLRTAYFVCSKQLSDDTLDRIAAQAKTTEQEFQIENIVKAEEPLFSQEEVDALNEDLDYDIYEDSDEDYQVTIPQPIQLDLPFKPRVEEGAVEIVSLATTEASEIQVGDGFKITSRTLRLADRSDNQEAIRFGIPQNIVRDRRYMLVRVELPLSHYSMYESNKTDFLNPELTTLGSSEDSVWRRMGEGKSIEDHLSILLKDPEYEEAIWLHQYMMLALSKSSSLFHL